MAGGFPVLKPREVAALLHGAAPAALGRMEDRAADDRIAVDRDRVPEVVAAQAVGDVSFAVCIIDQVADSNTSATPL